MADALLADAAPPDTEIHGPPACYAALRSSASLRACYADGARRAAIAALIGQVARKHDVKVISWDVFDTALLREAKCEARRFLEISERFVAHCRATGPEPAFSALDAFLARAMAAQAGYAMAPLVAGNREGRFREIAATVCDILGRPDLADAYLVNELAYEAAAVVANPLVAAVAGEVPHVGILFLSDIYLEGDNLASLLAAKFGFRGSGWVLSSADGHGSKRTGGLFVHAQARLKVAPSRILHIGDSFRGDFQMARHQGWRAFYLPLPDAEERARRQCHVALRGAMAPIGIDMDAVIPFNM